MDFTPEETEIIKILSKLNPSCLKINNSFDKTEILQRCEKILLEYYLENTRGIKGKWMAEFENSGITEDEGKNAISCGRRIGMNIS